MIVTGCLGAKDDVVLAAYEYPTIIPGGITLAEV